MAGARCDIRDLTVGIENRDHRGQGIFLGGDQSATQPLSDKLAYKEDSGPLEQRDRRRKKKIPRS